MTARQGQIWDLVMGEEYLTAKEIGRLLNISDRTVRSDIREINREKGREVILSKRGKGYYMEGVFLWTKVPNITCIKTFVPGRAARFTWVW